MDPKSVSFRFSAFLHLGPAFPSTTYNVGDIEERLPSIGKVTGSQGTSLTLLNQVFKILSPAMENVSPFQDPGSRSFV